MEVEVEEVDPEYVIRRDIEPGQSLQFFLARAWEKEMYFLSLVVPRD